LGQYVTQKRKLQNWKKWSNKNWFKQSCDTLGDIARLQLKPVINKMFKNNDFIFVYSVEHHGSSFYMSYKTLGIII